MNFTVSQHAAAFVIAFAAGWIVVELLERFVK